MSSAFWDLLLRCEENLFGLVRAVTRIRGWCMGRTASWRVFGRVVIGRDCEEMLDVECWILNTGESRCGVECVYAPEVAPLSKETPSKAISCIDELLGN